MKIYPSSLAKKNFFITLNIYTTLYSLNILLTSVHVDIARYFIYHSLVAQETSSFDLVNIK